MSYLDGNVLAGPISDLFGFEPTVARGQCHHCGDIDTLGQAVVYASPMGLVVRCRNCEQVLIVIVERDGQRSVSMRGLRLLHVPSVTSTTSATS